MASSVIRLRIGIVLPRAAHALPMAGAGACIAAAVAPSRAEPRAASDESRLLRELARATEQAVSVLEASKQKGDMLRLQVTADTQVNSGTTSSASAQATDQAPTVSKVSKEEKNLLAATTAAANTLESSGASRSGGAAPGLDCKTMQRTSGVHSVPSSASKALGSVLNRYWTERNSKPTMLATELSKASGLRGLQPLELVKVFSTINNIVTQSVLLQALPQADPTVVERLFEIFAGDADEDGVDDIDFRTFACAAAIMTDAKPAAKLKLMFELCDEDTSGSLTRDELRLTLGSLLSAVSALSLNPHDSETLDTICLELVDAVMAEADTDKSGTITREEFVIWAASGTEPAEFLSQSLLMFLKPRSVHR